MLVVADINTIWRGRPFAALAERRPVLGLKPRDRLTALKEGRLPFGQRRGSDRNLKTLSVVLPFGWASRRADKIMPRLWGAAIAECQRLGAKPTGLVVTSPHYAPMMEAISATLPCYYYCSDDYLNYEGWDAEEIRGLEARVMRCVRHSFFVSTALQERAMRDYAVGTHQVSVSMNATEESFLIPVAPQKLEMLFRAHPKLKRPVVGVVGGINERIDFALLRSVADLREIGSLLLVGKMAKPIEPACLDLLNHPRVLAVGEQPHDSLPAWQQLLDVALIPYRKSGFNYFCSPMRLFDHLAAGRPIVATDACAQTNQFGGVLSVANTTTDFLKSVQSACSALFSKTQFEGMRTIASENLWSSRARDLHHLLPQPL